MPKISATGFEKRIAAHPQAQGLSRSKIQRLAAKLVKRANAMQEQFDFFAEMRVLGLVSDPTARDAIRNVEG